MTHYEPNETKQYALFCSLDYKLLKYTFFFLLLPLKDVSGTLLVYKSHVMNIKLNRERKHRHFNIMLVDFCPNFNMTLT